MPSPIPEKNIKVKVIERAGPLGLTAFMTYVGAAIYFVQQSNGGFWEVILALLQAIVWPVYVIYHVLTALGA
jgi:hypothetical protein